ncbi:MAG: hypothetical protein O2826_11390 [Chloroflexi bacterium]|nr:hypothetical protein [Chloroflexota bacterium]MDA1175103.1 hypothetical protein [Chloroflexota bacterium]
MSTVRNQSRGSLTRMPPAWVVVVGVLTLGAANLAFIVVAFAAGRLG